MGLYSIIIQQIVGLYENRFCFRDGKYRPYFKWFAIPFAVSLAALGVVPGTGLTGKIVYAIFTLLMCELCWSVLNIAALSMLPLVTRGDINRTRFVSFSNASSILAFIAVSILVMPVAAFFGGGNMQTGVFFTLLLLAGLSVPLHFGAYLGLKERYFTVQTAKLSVRDIYAIIVRNKRLLLFLAVFCLYSMADSFRSQTAYYYMMYIMGQPLLLPVFIMTGLFSSLAAQFIIPRLLSFARKETLVAAGLFASASVCLLVNLSGISPFVLIIYSVLYGVFTAIVANLSFTVLASFADEIQERHKMNMSDVLTATMSLSSKIGIMIVSGAAPFILVIYGYSAQALSQSSNALFSIKFLFFVCPAIVMAIAGIVMLYFIYSSRSSAT
jgi:GPH family glycoside/pentoside/hexuronide:cation symporter